MQVELSPDEIKEVANDVMEIISDSDLDILKRIQMIEEWNEDHKKGWE